MTVQEVIQAIRLDGLSVDGGVRRIQQFIEGLAEATELLEELEQYRALGTVEELKEAIEFKKYFDELYGEGLEIANWHKNGDLEPFDSFYESALKWSEEDN